MPRAQKMPPSFEDLSIEELSEDEIGYDADIEVLRPDQCEEPDSDHCENKRATIEYRDYECWQNKLVEGMMSLDCNSTTYDSQELPETPPGRKRTSVEITGSNKEIGSSAVVDTTIGVMEVADDLDATPNPKRMRRKSRRTRTSERIVHRLPRVWTDVRDLAESTSAAMASSESSAKSKSSFDRIETEFMDID